MKLKCFELLETWDSAVAAFMLSSTRTNGYPRPSAVS